MKNILKFLTSLLLLVSGPLALAQYASNPYTCNYKGYPTGVIVGLVLGEIGPPNIPSATGLLLSTDGMIVTSYQAIKGAERIQVRTPRNGKVNQAILVAYDEASDLAVLRTDATTTYMPVPSTRSLSDGDAVYAMARKNGDALGEPSMAVGRVRSVTKANHVTGGKVQYETIQFAAPLTSDALGSALLDCDGRIVGMVTNRRDEDGYYVAVAFSSLLDYVTLSSRVFASGKDLKLPGEGPTEASVHLAQPKAIAKKVRTFYVSSETVLIPRNHILQELRNEKDFSNLDLVLTDDPSLADVMVVVDYIPWTFDYTFKAFEQKGKVIIAAGKVTEFNGYLAAPALAKEMVEQLKPERTALPIATAAKN